MPSTVNGIGTHYFGKRNRATRKGTCTHCGQRVELKSYDTWHCACFLMIPVIPLGRRRILDECPVCTSHAVMPLDQYNDLVQLGVPAAYERYEQEINLQTATQLHGVLLSVRNMQGAKEVREESLEALPNHQAELKSLYAWQLIDFRQHELAQKLFGQAIDADPENHAARAGITLYELSTGDIDVALQRMDFLTEKGAGGDPYFHLLGPLITACQEKNRHEVALRLSDHMLSENPDFARSDAFRSRHRLLEKRMRRRKSSLPGSKRSVLSVFRFGDESVAQWKRLTAYGCAILLLVSACIALANWYVAGHRKVYVICGEDGPLELVFDQAHPLSLKPGMMETRIAEGDHVAVLRNRENGRQISTSFKIDSSFPKRLFTPTTWVFNATGSHMILHVRYSKLPTPPVYQIHSRFGLHGHKDLDYVFTDPPDKVSLPEGKQSTTRKVVTEIPLSVDQSLAFKRGFGRDRQLFAVAKEYFPLLPHNPELASLLAQVARDTAKEEEAAELLREQLTTYPPRREIHRAYLSLVEDLPRERDLRHLYQQWQTDHGESVDVLMLQASVAPTVGQRLALLRKAETRSQDSTPQHSAEIQKLIAETLFRAARFKEAHTLYEMLDQQHPEQLDFSDHLYAHQTRIRVNGIDNETQRCRSAMQGEVFSIHRFCLLNCLLMQNDRAGAEQLVRQTNHALRQNPDGKTFHIALRCFYRRMAGITQPRYRGQFNPQEDVEQQLAEVLAGGTEQQLRTILEDEHCEQLDGATRFVVSAVLRMHGQSEQADRWLATSIKQLSQSGIVDHQHSLLLDSDGPPKLEQIEQLLWRPPMKAILCADLARRFPNRGDTYAQAARDYYVSPIHWGTIAKRLIGHPDPHAANSTGQAEQ